MAPEAHFFYGTITIVAIMALYTAIEKKWFGSKTTEVVDNLLNPQYVKSRLNKAWDKLAMRVYLNEFHSSKWGLTQPFSTDEANIAREEFHMELDELIQSFNDKIKRL